MGRGRHIHSRTYFWFFFTILSDGSNGTFIYPNYNHTYLYYKGRVTFVTNSWGKFFLVDLTVPQVPMTWPLWNKFGLHSFIPGTHESSCVFKSSNKSNHSTQTCAIFPSPQSHRYKCSKHTIPSITGQILTLRNYWAYPSYTSWS